MINRFLLFWGLEMQADGGFLDFAGDFPTVNAAEDKVIASDAADWAHVVDGRTGIILAAWHRYDGAWELQ
jgi:hypothetical protein